MATIIQVCLSSNCGGLEIYIERISRALSHRGHRVQVVTLTGSYLAQRLPADINYPIKAKGVAGAARFGLRISNRILAESADVAHVHGGRELPYAVLAKLRSRRRIRLVYSRHIVLNRSKKDLWHRALYRHVDAYLAVSEQIWEQALRRVPVPAQKVHFLRHGMELPANEPDARALARAKLGFRDNCFLVGTFSRIEHAKGQHTLIEAVSLLRKRAVDVRAFIMGHVSEPAYGEHLTRLVRELQLDAHVVFLDFVPDAHRLMSACDAIALPSRQEGSPLVAFEAMAASVPVLVTRGVGGALTLIEQEESGLVFDWEDAAMLAQHLEALYRDPDLRARLARNGRGLVERHFSFEDHLNTLENHFFGQAASC